MSSQGVLQLNRLIKRNLKPSDQCKHINLIQEIYVSLCYEDEANKSIVSFINKLLSNSKNHLSVLNLLNDIIYKIPTNIILDNYVLWFTKCISFNSCDILSSIKLEVLGKIIVICRKNQDFDKFIKGHLHKLLKVCLSSESNLIVNVSTLNCIKICIENYPSACKPLKSHLEQSLIPLINTDQPIEFVHKLGTVLHLLQQIEGSSPKTDGRSNWTIHFYKLCATIHRIYDDFFEDIMEYTDKVDFDVTPYSIISKENSGHTVIIKQNERSAVLKNLINLLKIMLMEKFPHQKTASPHVMVSVFMRGLMVDIYSEHENSIEEIKYKMILYKHQIQLLHLLQCFMLCFKQNLIPFSKSITKITIDCLQRTQKQYFQSDHKYHKAVHKTICCWIRILQNNLNPGVHNKIALFILQDITPKLNNVILNFNNILATGTDQSQQVAKNEIKNIITNLASTTNDNCPRDLMKVKEYKCISALKTFITLLEHTLLQVDEIILNEFLKIVINNLLLIQARRPDNFYTNEKCVVLLYQLFYALFYQKSFCGGEYVQTAISIFRCGKNYHQNTAIICDNSLNTLEKFCQPICRPLAAPTTFKRLENVNNLLEKEKHPFKNVIESNIPTVDNNSVIPSPVTLPTSTSASISCPDTVSKPKSPKPNKNVNILQVKVIKQNGTTNVVTSRNATKKHTAKQDNDNFKNNVRKSVGTTSLIAEKRSQPSSTTTKPNQKEEPIAAKQMKIHEDDTEEKLMLASFHDVIN